MKMKLLMKHTLKENYKYFISISLIYAFLTILYLITDNANIRLYGIQIVTYGVTIVNALLVPSILFRNYYRQTDANHFASIPMKRLEIFFSLYFIGLIAGVSFILLHTCFTVLLMETTASFVGYSSTLLVVFMYYYHLALLAFWICGHTLFQILVTLVMIFGPALMYILYQWVLEMYIETYVSVASMGVLMKLLPALCGCVYWQGLAEMYYYPHYLNGALGLFLLTLLAVRYRRYERTGQSMVYNSLSYVVRSFIVLLGSATLFALFGTILGSKEVIPQLIVGAIVSVIVAYVVEMIYKKNTKVFHSIKYGLLTAVVLVAALQFGTRTLEDYIPRHSGIVNVLLYNENLNSSKAYQGNTGLGYEDVIYDLNKELLDYYKNHQDDLKNNVRIGYLRFEYMTNDTAIFKRSYDITEEMQEKILNKEKYRTLFLGILTNDEWKVKEAIENEEKLTFNINNHVYIVDDISTRYLLDNYLTEELAPLIQVDVEKNIFEAFKSDTAIFWEDEKGNSYITLSQPLLNALEKTFKINAN